MSEPARLSPVPLILAALLAVAALVFSRGPSPPARSAPLGHTSPSPGQASPSAGPTPQPALPACARGDVLASAPGYGRSEERRVGKECRTRRELRHQKN